jgi:peptidoglycan/LPS O-acetylase OafA/YrhL
VRGLYVRKTTDKYFARWHCASKKPSFSLGELHGAGRQLGCKEHALSMSEMPCAPRLDPAMNERVFHFSSKGNCFDLLRLLLALGVVYSHSYYVGGFGLEPLAKHSKEQIILGGICVLGFFGLSGFLVAASFENSRNVGIFALKRIRRIFPAFWACLGVTAFVIAPLIWLVTGRALGDFPWTGADGAFSYFFSNLLLKVQQQSIGETVSGFPDGGTLNGSLWSLYPEFGCYVMLALLGLCGVLTRSKWFALILTTLVLVYAAVDRVQGREAFPAIPALFAFSNLDAFIAAFLVGMCAQLWKEQLAFTPRFCAGIGLLMALLLAYGGFRIAAPVLVPLFLLGVGSLFSLRLKADFSYGIYIYSFPLQQLLFAGSLGVTSVWLFFILSMVLSVVFAACSWFGIEKRALHRG